MTNARSVLALSVSLLLVGTLPGCVGMLLGAGATAGVAASEERGFAKAVSDTEIRAEINHLWLQKDFEMYRQVSLTVNEGRVLLTGTVPTPEARIEAVRACWQAGGVKTVINEIQVKNDGGGFLSYSSDVIISQKMKAGLLFDKDVYNINYTVDVNDGVIYLMGIAQTQKELDKVMGHARDISGVKGVVNHILLKDDPRRTAAIK